MAEEYEDLEYINTWAELQAEVAVNDADPHSSIFRLNEFWSDGAKLTRVGGLGIMALGACGTFVSGVGLVCDVMYKFGLEKASASLGESIGGVLVGYGIAKWGAPEIERRSDHMFERRADRRLPLDKD